MVFSMVPFGDPADTRTDIPPSSGVEFLPSSEQNSSTEFNGSLLEKRIVEQVRYNYFVRRTKSENLPVYNLSKHGGSLQLTTIYHVEGNPGVSRSSPLVV